MTGYELPSVLYCRAFRPSQGTSPRFGLLGADPCIVSHNIETTERMARRMMRVGLMQECELGFAVVDVREYGGLKDTVERAV